MKEKLSLDSLGLKRKILVAVSLITILPLLVLVYYFYKFRLSTPTPIILTFIIFLGWMLIFEVFSTVCRVNIYTKKTLENLGEETPAITNEVKSLESVINILSVKVKDSFEQLRDFSHKTDELNKEVSKKVIVLSTILQANELFSKNAPYEEIIQLLSQRLREILDMKMSFCSFKDSASDKFIIVAYSGIEASRVESFLERESGDLSKITKTLVLDKENKPLLCKQLTQELTINNMALAPVISKRDAIGLICVGNNQDDFVFDADHFNILNLFSQNIALIWEHRKLSVKVDELEVVDYLTGLYNEKFLFKRLEEEIKRSVSYQRPCGFLLMEVPNYDTYQKDFGLIEAERLLKKIAKIFKEVLRPIDIAGRTGSNKLGAILIEKNKRQSQKVVFDLKQKLDEVLKEPTKIVFSIAENPLDGTTAEELISFAQSHLSSALTNEIP
jgi:diguanylate cyclase (GGDEF)-like protein